MRFSLMTEPQLGGTFHDLRRAAQAAEGGGLSGFARSDHIYWTGAKPLTTTEAFTTLGGLAMLTTSIRLVVLVTPITFRHPAVIAKAAATLDEMSGGRFDLGIGTGWMEAEHSAFGLPFPEARERYARLEEAVQYLRAVFGGESYSGRYYQSHAQALPRPGGIRMVLGGSGAERTPRLAGSYADEYNLFSTPVAGLSARVERMQEAASAVGRDPAAVEVSIMGPAVLADSEAGFQRRLEIEADLRKTSAADLESRWSRNGVPMGTADRAAEAIARLSAAGVGSYYLQCLDLADHEHIQEQVSVAAGLGSV